MNGISCFVNFKENLSKNVPYYSLLMKQICDNNEAAWIGENAAFSVGHRSNVVTKICEGYQFTIAFSGSLLKDDALRKELDSFGYHFLSEKDAELALLCYIHFGEKCTSRLLGDFSFIIYDAMRRQVFAFSKSAKSPLFYGKASNGYVLCSSMHGLLSCPGITKRIPCENILELISVQNRITDMIFEGVYCLPPLCSLKISCNGLWENDGPSSDAEPEKIAHPAGKITSVLLSGTSFDLPVIKSIQESKETVNIYSESIPCEAKHLNGRIYPLSIDKGTLLYGLEASVSACGFPVLSDFDYLLPIAIRRAHGRDDVISFLPPDRFSSYKSYLSVLIDNDAFHPVFEENLASYTHTAKIIPDYPSLIGDFFDVGIPLPPCHYAPSGRDNDPHPLSVSHRVKTALRHILLEIISKDHAPILAFFKSSALLRLCEGRFLFPQGFGETELTAYLIKLNIWLEKYSPRFI